MSDPNEEEKKNLIDINPVDVAVEGIDIIGTGEAVLDGVGAVIGQAGEAVGGVLQDIPVDVVDISI